MKSPLSFHLKIIRIVFFLICLNFFEKPHLEIFIQNYSNVSLRTIIALLRFHFRKIINNDIVPNSTKLYPYMVRFVCLHKILIPIFIAI